MFGRVYGANLKSNFWVQTHDVYQTDAFSTVRGPVDTNQDAARRRDGCVNGFHDFGNHFIPSDNVWLHLTVCQHLIK